AADKFKDTLSHMRKKPKALILRMRHVPAMDATGLRVLEDVYEKARKEGTTLILAGVHSQPLKLIKQSELFEKLGSKNIKKEIDEALEYAAKLIPKGASKT